MVFLAITNLQCNGKRAQIEEGETEIANYKIDTTIDFNKSVELELQNAPKLFLKFWYGMSKLKFEYVSQKLNDEKVLINSDYAVDGCKTNISPKFVDDKLISIELQNSECLYPLYQEKYKLMPLVDRKEIVKQYIENNPEYNPKMSYKKEGHEYKLSDLFIDKSSFVPEGLVRIKESDIKSSKVNVLPKSPIYIEKGEVVIKISQELKYYTGFYDYSLDLMKIQRSYSKDRIANFQLNESQFIITNSKLRTVSKYLNPVITITYMSKMDYEKEKRILMEEKRENLKNQEFIKERKKSVLDEI